MRAVEVLAAHEGFVWKMEGGSSPMQLVGSDATGWTSFWMAGLIPVARFGRDADHARSAFGRYVAEGLFLTPAALLPAPHVSWKDFDDNTARVIVRRNNLEQAVDVTVDADGRPMQVVFPRWSNANPDKVYRIQPFGGRFSEFREFQGFRLPTHVEAGNFFGTPNYFPFSIADVTSIRFPQGGMLNATGGSDA